MKPIYVSVLWVIIQRSGFFCSSELNYILVALFCYVCRGNPSVQGNSVFALAGLAQAVSLFVQQQTSSGTTEQFQRNTEWLSMVADTVMVVLDGSYKPKGPTLVWCQQVNDHCFLYHVF